MMKFKILFFFLLLIVFRVQAQNAIKKLSTLKDFKSLSGAPLSDRYGNIASIKVVYDLETDQLYFINANRFKYHYEFCATLSVSEIDLFYFNEVNYKDNPKRAYLLGNINYYPQLQRYALETSAADLMPLKQINVLFQAVKSHAFFGDSLNYLMNSARLLNNEIELKSLFPILYPSDIYAKLNFQAIGKHIQSGRLKFVNDITSKLNDIQPEDIIVINTTPIYLPTVAGVIVTEFQTPLSHLTILAQNRKIPICAYKQAFMNETLKMYHNQLVNFEVTKDTFFIKPIKTIVPTKLGVKTKLPKANLSIMKLIDIKNLGKYSVDFVGNKAANFGELYQLSLKSKFKVPEAAFAIPFSFYKAHVDNYGITDSIQLLLNTPAILNDQAALKKYLKAIRKKIMAASMDTCLLMTIENKIVASGDYNRFRFRSSTNAEDTKGFSGAGLYTSETGILGDEKKSIAMAIKKVWASLWSYEAFTERCYYQINHNEVYMGVLVHRSFPEEAANGVVITKNLYREDNFGFIVNAQLGDKSVVKPDSGVVCDQFICYPNGVNNIYNNKRIVDVIAMSNLNNGKLVMTESEIQNMADQIDYIKKHFVSKSISLTDYLNYGLDIEFKLDGVKRELYIKQVRVYND
jgi:pyruvate, water dikinase